eukprot:COSAG06_NODE_1423_length_9499_cov_65.511967_4_plen_44_part_00
MMSQRYEYEQSNTTVVFVAGFAVDGVKLPFLAVGAIISILISG